MRQAKIYINGQLAGLLIKRKDSYLFKYEIDYKGPSVSLTMPISTTEYQFKQFPPFFDGLLPEGPQLEALLKKAKLDREDYFGQLVKVGQDLIGAVTVEEIA